MIEPSFLGTHQLFLPGGVVVTFAGYIDDEERSCKYSNEDGAIAMFTLNNSTGGLHGYMQYNRRDYVLEYCGDEGHVFIEYKLAEIFLDDEYRDDGWKNPPKLSPSADEPTLAKNEDSFEIVTFTVQIYFTTGFARTTKDVAGFIHSMIDSTNDAYESSQVPMRIKVHCTQEVNIPDNISSKWALKYLERLKPTANEVRNSADVAVLLVDSLKKYCGQAKSYAIDEDATDYGYAISVVKKSCIKGYTFSHEIGHNIGLYHDKRHRNLKYPYAQGSYIEKGKSWTGYRSIMAYARYGHYRRVPYFSNPNVIYPMTGTPTGIMGEADNAKLLFNQRFKLANLGDESKSCGEGIIDIEVGVWANLFLFLKIELTNFLI